MTVLVVVALVVSAAVEAVAQERPASPATMDHALLNLFPAREVSGTAWQPDVTARTEIPRPCRARRRNLSNLRPRVSVRSGG